MKITDIITAEKPSLSFEVFPPKTSDNFDTVEKAALEIADLKPSFMSVTYGAGGGTSQFTADIAEHILNCGVTPLAHLTCISSTGEAVKNQLKLLKEKGIENILALRGDILPDTDLSKSDYRYASDLTKEIADFGGFCIGGACYPECHPDSTSSDSDIESLKIKGEPKPDVLEYSFVFREVMEEKQQDKAQTYTAEEGECLWDISYKFGVPIDTLVKFNPNVKRPDISLEGRVIRLC